MTQRSIAVAALVLAVLAALAAGIWYFLAGENSSGPAAAAGRGQAGVRAVAVVTAQPVRKTFAHEVEALGTLRANESVDITAVVDRVTAIRFTEGQQVRKGDVLVELESNEARR